MHFSVNVFKIGKMSRKAKQPKKSFLKKNRQKTIFFRIAYQVISNGVANRSE